MKKKVIIILVAIILLVLLFPIKNQLKDGGTVEYKSLTYKVSIVHKRSETEHEDGILVETFGKEIFNNCIVEHIERPEYFTNSELSHFALEYFFKTAPEWTLSENVSKEDYHVGISEDVIEKYQKQDMVVIEIRHINNNINNTLDARYYINVFTAKGFDDSGNEIDLNL